MAMIQTNVSMNVGGSAEVKPGMLASSPSAMTVKTHVAQLFSKLDLRDRAQAVVTAYETGLIQPGT